MFEYDTICQGDCLSGMKAMPDACVDTIVTSPPYNKKGQSKKKGNQIWGGFRIDYDSYQDSLDNDEYDDWMRQLLCEFNRILKPNGSVFFNHKVILENCTAHFPSFVLDCGIHLYQLVVWNRMCSCNIRNDTLFPTYELVFWLSKGKPNVYKEQATYKNDIWNIPPEKNSEHPAPFPYKLAENCILLTNPKNSGNLIFDPFMGSGTTAVAAKNTGNHFLGFELSEDYRRMAMKRIANVKSFKNGIVQNDLFGD